MEIMEIEEAILTINEVNDRHNLGASKQSIEILCRELYKIVLLERRINKIGYTKDIK